MSCRTPEEAALLAWNLLAGNGSNATWNTAIQHLCHEALAGVSGYGQGSEHKQPQVLDGCLSDQLVSTLCKRQQPDDLQV